MESSGEVCDGTERKPPPVVESEFRERKSSTQSPRASNSQSSSNARGNVISSSSSGDDAPGGSEQSTDSSSSPPSSPVTKDERSTGSGDEAVKLPSKKSGQPKRDRSKLRKGKWTVRDVSCLVGIAFGSFSQPVACLRLKRRSTLRASYTTLARVC